MRNFTVAIALLFVLLSLVTHCDAECPQNEEIVGCVTPCTHCKYLSGCPIRVKCESGCDCKQGFARTDDRSCIRKEHCPKSVRRCGQNERPSDCVNPCNDCETRGNCQFLVCNEGCECVPGFHRETLPNGPCIPENQCPQRSCPHNEEYTDCGTACPKTCANYRDVNTACIALCVPGCFCKNDLVRDKNGKCIRPEQCTSVRQCGINERPSECVNPCNDCEIRGNCQFLVCNEGCECLPGFHSKTLPNGPCIPENKCPQNARCPKNEQYSECGTACPKTCDNFDKTDQICIDMCVKGCFCQNDLVRGGNGNCIHPRSCYKPRNRCPKNEEIVSCVKPAWCNTCDIRGNCKLASDSCRFGCDCKAGYYRIRGKCMPQELCDSYKTSETVVCKDNEVLANSGPACESCGDFRCLAIIEETRCYCKPGYLRDENKNCIPAEDCPKTKTT